MKVPFSHSSDAHARGDAPLRGGALQRGFTAKPTLTGLPPVVHETLQSAGRPLDAPIRADMESNFNHDFSQVRVHTDARAAESARAVNARAYTVGRDVVFGESQYAPTSHRGRELLGHELAHTIQQRNPSGGRTSAAPQGIFESSAEAAGRDIANGGSSTRDLPACGIGLARSPVPASALNDQQLADELQRANESLKQGGDPGWWLLSLRYEAQKRAISRQPVGPQPLPKPKAPPPDPVAERAAAVVEAEAQIARMEQTEKDDDNLPVPKPAARRRKPAALPSNSLSLVPADPRQISDDQIYGETNAALKRIDEDIARDREITKKPYSTRLYEARRSLRDYHENFRLLTADQVWLAGLKNGLFVEGEKKAVYADQGGAVKEREADNERTKMQYDYEQQQRRDQFYQNLQLAPIQATLMGGAGGFAQAANVGARGLMAANVVEGAYTTYAFADTAIQTHRAATTGTPSDVVSALLPLATGLVVKRMAGGFETTSPTPRGGAEPVGGMGIQEASPAQVRQLYKANPYRVQKSVGSEWHQQQWEANGGTGEAPIAFRTKEGMIRVDENRWLAVGELSEINSPADMAPARAPAPAKKAPPVDPLGKTGEVIDPLAKTPAPADPKAPTQPTPPPMPKAAPKPQPRGYTPVEPRVVIEAYQINPNVISISHSVEFHQMVWEHAGSRGPAPVAYRVGNQIRVDMTRWPAGQRGLIGQGMSLTP